AFRWVAVPDQVHDGKSPGSRSRIVSGITISGMGITSMSCGHLARNRARDMPCRRSLRPPGEQREGVRQAPAPRRRGDAARTPEWLRILAEVREPSAFPAVASPEP